MLPYHSLYCNALGWVFTAPLEAGLPSHLVSFPFYSSQEIVWGSAKSRSFSIEQYPGDWQWELGFGLWFYWLLDLPLTILQQLQSILHSGYARLLTVPECALDVLYMPSIRCSFWSTILQGSTHMPYPWETHSDAFRQLCVLSFVVPRSLHTSIRSFIAFWIFQLSIHRCCSLSLQIGPWLEFGEEGFMSHMLWVWLHVFWQGNIYGFHWILQNLCERSIWIGESINNHLDGTKPCLYS